MLNQIKDSSYLNHFLFIFFLLNIFSFYNNSYLKAQVLTSNVSDYDPNKVNVLAFPGAEGFGRYTTGGRGGQVIKVTNLNDSGPGSLREAVEQKGPRIVVFEVSGTIDLKSNISIGDSNLTIAGQTAPGDGITIKNYRFTILEKNNIIIRFLRFRLGDLTGREANPIFIRDCSNIIIDHCTMSWGTDETATNFKNKNLTMQWCIISEGLNNSVHSKGEHGFGAIWGGINISYHHNLLAHFTQRSPAFDNLSLYASETEANQFRGVVDFRNNVIYNWDFRAIDGGEKGTFNVINNYFKPGPATGNTNFFLYPTSSSAKYGKYFVSGNILENNATVNSDNWKGVRLENDPLTEQYLQSTKLFSALPSDVYEYSHSAQEAYQKTLDFAGASLVRDAVDTRIVKETRNKIFTFNGSNGSKLGIIDSQKDVGGWPVLKSTPAPIDTDGDGIPDFWETANNLNPTVTNDREYNLNPYYTDIEIYINSLVQPIVNQTNPGVPSPVKLLLPSPSSTISPIEASFAWAPVSNATSFRLQISKSSDFSTNVITLDNLAYLSFLRNQLDPSTTYYWRVRASNDFGSGPYSSISTFKTSALNVVPGMPILLNPSNNTTGIAIKPELSWSRVPNSTGYRLQISTVSSFSSLVTDQSNLSGTTFTPSNLKENTLYFWRVRAFNETGTGGYSQVGSFKTVSFDVIPEVTLLTRPANNSTVNPLGIMLEWEPNPTAEFYRLQVSTSNDFSVTSNYIINKEGLTNTFYFIDNLNSNKTYYWRVRAYNRKSTDYNSSTFTLKTSSFTVTPKNTKLISPMDEANIFSTSIKFTWEEPIAKSYRLQVSTSESFNTFVTNISGITTTTYTVSNLIRNTQYYWRIIPSNEAGTGNPSEVRKVRSASSSSTIAPPKLSSPIDKSTIPSNNILFKWENQPNSAFYRIQISTSSSFSSLVVNQTNIQGTSFQIPKLNDNTTYYWRVRGWNGTITGIYSQVFSFKTGTVSTNPPNQTLESPKNNVTNQPLSLILTWQPFTNAESYIVEVSESNSFSTLFVNQSWLTGTNFFIQNLKPNTKYFWRVTPTIKGVESTPSETWAFTTENTNISSPIIESLVGHWKMDEGSGNTFIDHSGNGNTGEIINPSGVSWTTGKLGQAAIFNSNFLPFGLVKHNSTIDLTKQLTISAWIRPNAVENKGILSKLSGDGYEFRIISGGKIEFRINRATSGTRYKLLSNQSYIADGKTWTHVAVTFSGNNSTLYINGKEDNSIDFNLVSIISNTSDLRIGAVGNGNRWNGGLDDMRLYNKALTENEISTLYENSDFSITQAKYVPIGYWKMDEGSGDVFIDHSGNENHASILNPEGISWVPGRIGQAARFSTLNWPLGTVPHNPTIDITQQITIAAWIKPNSLENKGILSKLSGDGYEFRILSDGKLEFRINRATSGTTYRLRSNQSYVGNGSTWTHVAVTFNGTKSAIFINGVEDNSATYPPVQIISNTADLRIGAIATGNRWNGQLDEIRLYDKALNSVEILDIFNGNNIVARTSEILEENKNKELSTDLSEIKNDLTHFQDIKIYPNPVHDKLNILMNSLQPTQIKLGIYDQLGRQYLENTLFTENGQIMIDLSGENMAPGLYILIVDNGLIGMKKIKFLKK
jgi:hypothetical protein